MLEHRPFEFPVREGEFPKLMGEVLVIFFSLLRIKRLFLRLGLVLSVMPVDVLLAHTRRQIRVTPQLFGPTHSSSPCCVE
jgi:hypothetical protein